MKFSEETNKLIKSVIKNKKHVKFTIGVLYGDETNFKLFDSNAEIPYENHYYEIGSITKIFTTSLLAKYLQSGKMSLEDSIARYIPELDDGKYYPTIKRLATHTAGYPGTYPMSKKECFSLVGKQLVGKPVVIRDYLKMDFEKMIHLIKGTKLQNKDYKWKYANFGISLLGYAVSNIAGGSFGDVMTDFLTQDLYLKNSFLGMDSSQILNGYDYRNRNVGNWDWGSENYITPAGGITSTAEDLLAFAKQNIEESPDYLGRCHELYAKKSKKISMGLGWWIDGKNDNIYYHGGNTEGFASMLAFDKKKKAAVVLLANICYFKEREKLFADILENL